MGDILLTNFYLLRIEGFILFQGLLYHPKQVAFVGKS